MAAIGARLRSAHVDTGSAMGSFGRIDLSLGALEPVHTDSFRCPDTHEVLFRESVRRGTLTGSFDFTPNEGSLPDLRVMTMHAFAVRETDTGRTRPDSYPASHPCRGPRTLEVTDATQGAFLSGSLGSYGFSGLSVDRIEHVTPATIYHSIGTYLASAGVITVTSSGVSVDASALSPLLSGTLSLTAGATTMRAGAHCVLLKTAEDWSSGTLTANFDSGSVDFTGAGLRAVVRGSRKP